MNIIENIDERTERKNAIKILSIGTKRDESLKQKKGVNLMKLSELGGGRA